MLEFKRQNPAGVTNPQTGYDVLFLDNTGKYYTKDSAGVLTLLGNGIASIAKISTVGLVDTYRITYLSGATFDYTVTNGQDGVGQPANAVPTTIQPDATASIGTATTRFALQDHTHAIDAAAPTTNLSANTTNAEGTGTSFSRNDHSHAISTGVVGQITAGSTASAGTSPNLTRADHVHSVSTAAATGLDGGSTNTEGNATSLARSNHTHAIANGGTPSTVNTTNSQGTSTSLARADHVHAHGAQTDGTLHALATPNTTGGTGGTGGVAGFLSAALRTNIGNLFGTGAVYNIKDFGAVADDTLGAGGTDNTTAIQAAIDAAQAAGGGIVFIPAGNYSIQNGLTVRSTGVHIMGAGCGYTADVGDYRTGLASCISWRGAAGGVMLDVFPQSGASVFPLFGFRLSGLSLDGRDLQPGPTDTGATPPAIGIRMRACSGAHLHDFFLNGPFTTAALDLSTLAPGTIGGVDSHGVLRSIFERFCIRQLDGAVTPGIGLRLSGSATANVNFCKFDTFQIMYRNSSTRQPAIQLGNSDSNTFIMGACNSNGPLNTNWGIEILGSNTSAAEVSRANIFYHCSHGTGGTFLAGTALGRNPSNAADATLNFTNPSTDNQFRPLSTENGEPVPVFGTGATGGYGITGGSTGPRFMGEGSTLASRTTTLLVNTTTLTQVIGFTAPANFLRAGTVIECAMAGVVSNAAAASNHTVAIRIGGVVVAQSVIALGATARTNAIGNVNAKALVLTAGATGTATGPVTYYVTGGAAIVPTATTAPATINTTIANVIELVITASVATSTYNVLSAELRLANQ